LTTLLGLLIPANGSESGPFVATFDAQGGHPTPESQSVGVGEYLYTPTSPTLEGYNFVGWTRSLITKEIFDFETETLTEDTILYALWEEHFIGNPDGYYSSISASSGEMLINQLNALISVVTAGDGSENISYEQAKTMLQSSDRSTVNSNYLYGIYNSELLPVPWDHINNWNREHVWPQSLLGESASPAARNTATDAHNLRACNPSVNSSRSNKYFDNIISDLTYFPSDAHKGDVARILLYMTVRYNQLSLVDNAPNVKQMSRISLLLTWHTDDPVDAFEIQRNNVIYNWQGNRNPFIDNPQWFEAVWNYYMQQAGLQSKATAQFNNTINTYEILMTTYTPTQKRYVI